MNIDVKSELLRILEKLLTETSKTDYKQIPYYEDKVSDMIKEVSEFLNSEESYGENKFIIFGVVDNNRYIKGLYGNLVLDDKNHQSHFDAIFPRPMIETGIAIVVFSFNLLLNQIVTCILKRVIIVM